MNFRDATDALCEGVTHGELAEALGSSVASIRQARLDPRAKAHRAPPPNWNAAVAKLARSRADQLLRLAKKLER